ncbi:hypothetical protein DDV98_36595 [Streptomyces sp. IB2014 011-12]|nr:hypothetical protein DDV98_36595 [Streptomyces sp. IB2014 011-12]
MGAVDGARSPPGALVSGAPGERPLPYGTGHGDPAVGVRGGARAGPVCGGAGQGGERAGDQRGPWAFATGGVGGEPQHASTAYILFTSGSTGRPKGLVIRHADTDAYLRTLSFTAWICASGSLRPMSRISASGYRPARVLQTEPAKGSWEPLLNRAVNPSTTCARS